MVPTPVMLECDFGKSPPAMTDNSGKDRDVEKLGRIRESVNPDRYAAHLGETVDHAHLDDSTDQGCPAQSVDFVLHECKSLRERSRTTDTLTASNGTTKNTTAVDGPITLPTPWSR